MQTPLSNNKSNIQTGSNETHLERKLNTKHLSMIAIGGAVVADFIAGIMVCFVMTSLDEMAAFIPVTGSFFSTHTSAGS